MRSGTFRAIKEFFDVTIGSTAASSAGGLPGRLQVSAEFGGGKHKTLLLRHGAAPTLNQYEIKMREGDSITFTLSDDKGRPLHYLLVEGDEDGAPRTGHHAEGEGDEIKATTKRPRTLSHPVGGRAIVQYTRNLWRAKNGQGPSRCTRSYIRPSRV